MNLAKLVATQVCLLLEKLIYTVIKHAQKTKRLESIQGQTTSKCKPTPTYLQDAPQGRLPPLSVSDGEINALHRKVKAKAKADKGEEKWCRH